ncbi:hypothetical protein N7468_007376 [Penicillium chermesinum]|uniref:DUF6314 domain-containing protein n=1 Tax=Penicillium chermesinum TaxID=63820 RepID=A0A9W9NUQ9_9EURO|nr:uncharacterized protein N7468_007376 [Penicillium chermesinum]KAJ5226151.1 hypothetical protein N7468_007376 [Penicillium chermesinum]
MARPLASLITSLGGCRWKLTRTLRSDNPHDLNGELRGTAQFTPLSNSDSDWLYSEEGEIPSGGAGALPAGLRWTKKYIWRSSNDASQISVWFVKVAPGPEEVDYLFHNFDFSDAVAPPSDNKEPPTQFIAPTVPPSSTVPDNETTVLAARGNHLCINDMYRTAYSFRISSTTGEVLTWTSRHVVKGPKKDQEIINRYERGS